MKACLAVGTALQPATGETAEFAHQLGIGKMCTNHRREFSRHCDAHILCHIKSPMVHAPRQPVLHHATGFAVEHVTHCVVRQIELRNGAVALPAVVAAILAQREPVLFVGVARLRRQKPGVQVGDMVQHRVERQRHLACVQGFDQALQGGLTAKHRVDVEEIGRIVFVVTWRCKDGRQVDAGYAQINQVIELLGDAVEIAAAKVVATGVREIGIVPVVRHGTGYRVGRIFQLRGAGLAAANGKPVGENLIQHLAGGVPGAGIQGGGWHPLVLASEDSGLRTDAHHIKVGGQQARDMHKLHMSPTGRDVGNPVQEADGGHKVHTHQPRTGNNERILHRRALEHLRQYQRCITLQHSTEG